MKTEFITITVERTDPKANLRRSVAMKFAALDLELAKATPGGAVMAVIRELRGNLDKAEKQNKQT